jgi:hypothetical protein
VSEAISGDDLAACLPHVADAHAGDVGPLRTRPETESAQDGEPQPAGAAIPPSAYTIKKTNFG